jgi:hypothetical protein
MAVMSTPFGSSGEGEKEGKEEERLELYEIVGTER